MRSSQLSMNKITNPVKVGLFLPHDSPTAGGVFSYQQTIFTEVLKRFNGNYIRVYKIMIKKKIFPKTAIISQSNKNGLKEFANQIQNLGIDIFSTGGTASFLKKKKCQNVSYDSV